MKRFISIAAAALIAVTALTGCGKDSSGEATVKTGYAVLSSISNSKDATADAAGNAQADSTVVAVTVDKDGKVVQCVIDSVQTKVEFSTAGTITTSLDTTYQTKNELGEAYGMRRASGIKKEWNEQAAAFAAYVEGKTSEQIGGIALSEGVPTDADLASSVTIRVTNLISAVQKAIAAAQDLGAKADDRLGLGIVTNISKSENATAEKDGKVQAYSTYTVTTVDASGKITSCMIDASQTNIGISTAGKVTSDLAATLKTKNELGDAYDMKRASGIKKEWYEQAKAFADYTVGKTIEDVKGIALSEGVPSDADLTSSVTIHVTDFLSAIEKAVASAK